MQKIDKTNKYVLFARRKDYEEIKLKVKNTRFKIVEANIPWHSIKEQVLFPEILKHENLDLVHFPYFSVPIYYNRPSIITIHDLIQLHFPTGRASTLPWPFYFFKYLGYKYVILKASKQAKKIITVSNATKDEIIDHLKIPEEKIEVIYEGVEPVFRKRGTASSLRTVKRYGLNNRYFLFVGNVYPHKNVEVLIKAFGILLKYYPKTLLVFIGKEDYFYRKLKEKVRKIEFSSNLKFLGDVSDEELGNLYRNAIAEVTPSFMEGFGLPALEAMANKCLVIASDTASLKEICQENAIYFDPYDEKELGEKMKMAYERKFDERIIEGGFKRSKEFSWRRMAEKTLKVYIDIYRRL